MIEFERTYTVKEVAEILRVSVSTVYNLTQTNPDYGGIPRYKIGGSVRVKESDLYNWIEARKESGACV